MEGPDESRLVRQPLFTINCIREAVCRQNRFAAAGILLSALRPRRPAGWPWHGPGGGCQTRPAVRHPPTHHTSPSRRLYRSADIGPPPPHHMFVCCSILPFPRPRTIYNSLQLSSSWFAVSVRENNDNTRSNSSVWNTQIGITRKYVDRLRYFLVHQIVRDCFL